MTPASAHAAPVREWASTRGNDLRVMYIVKQFPQLSESYVKTEIEAVRERCEISIIALKQASLAAKNHQPFRCLADLGAIREAIEEFRPHVLHSHWLHSARIVGKLSQQTKIPFTIRTHSFDAIWSGDLGTHWFRFFGRHSLPPHIVESIRWIKSDLCLGILAFPFNRARLEKAGVPLRKIVDSYPVVNYPLFHNTAPNGDAIMNMGAAIKKKNMEEFIELATMAPELRFNLYAMAYEVEKLRALNEAKGNPVYIVPPVEIEDMPAEYKKHRWLVYTARKDMASVGWPMAVAEAQAAGVGVCLANIRPDLREYIGGAGFLFNSTGEVLDIITKPVPEEMRQLGFEQARKSNIFDHRQLLFDLWQKALV
jgi:glycosyltransferase involved in cell wall biosynthesis